MHRLRMLCQVHSVRRRQALLRNPRQLARVSGLLGIYPVAHQQHRDQFRQDIDRLLPEKICTGKENELVPQRHDCIHGSLYHRHDPYLCSCVQSSGGVLADHSGRRLLVGTADV